MRVHAAPDGDLASALDSFLVGDAPAILDRAVLTDHLEPSATYCPLWTDLACEAIAA